MNQSNQYKIGDRVVYHAGERAGNRELDGHVGTVIGTDGSRMPYTVEFDEPYANAMDDERFGGKKGHCWHCAAEHLSLLDALAADAQVQAKDKSERSCWSAEDLARLKEMKEAGMTARRIAQALGRTEAAIGFQWTQMKKRERASRENGAQAAESSDRADGEELPAEQSPTGEGTLNGLEQALSEIVSELKTENDALRGEAEDLRQTCVESAERITRLTEENLRLSEEAESLRAELTDTAGALSAAEEDMDELRAELQKVKSVLQRTQRLLEEKEKSYQADTELLYQRGSRLEQMEQLLSAKDTLIERLESQLSRATNVALGVTERLLLGGEEQRGI